MKYLSFLLPALLATKVCAWSQEWKEEFGDVEVTQRGHLFHPIADEEHASTTWAASNVTGKGYFKQLTDHKDPSKGTFDQFYYWSTEFWKGPGSPVIMFTPGEVNASAYTIYLTTGRVSGVIAKEIGAAIFVMEHRYWGNSTPFADLTTANMQYLTLENSILDLTYFANNIEAPWNSSISTKAADVPWIMTGGSYSGALSAWTESVAPGTYWAYHSSSAPVQAISDFAAYFYPVQEGMPTNCSTDLNLVINYMDDVLTSNDTKAIADLKAKFKLTDVESNDDFMGALENGPWLWQSNQFYTNYSPFFQFCDYIENVRNSSTTKNSPPPEIIPGPNGVGLEKALKGYADWFVNAFLPDYCIDTYEYPDFAGTYNTACFNTHNASSPMFTDTSLANTVSRSWEWMLCNEPFGYWQDGAPESRSTIVSRLIDAKYWIRQCEYFFPKGPNGETYGIAKGKSEADTNSYTGGWDKRPTTRLVYVNGGYDPWRDSGVSAGIRPGGPLQSTAQTPVYIVPGGFHTSDMIPRNGVANASCKAVQDKVFKQIVDWAGEWPGKKPWLEEAMAEKEQIKRMWHPRGGRQMPMMMRD